MKKLFLGFAAIAMTFTACGGQKSPDSIIGSWVMPIEGQPGKTQGIKIEEGGNASSINMATLVYKHWEQQPAKSFIPLESGTILPSLARRSATLRSKSMRPVVKSSWASLTSVSWRAEGSYISGLIPSGTSTSTGKSPHVTSSTSCFRGAILTNIVFFSLPSLGLEQPTARVANSMNMVKRNIVLSPNKHYNWQRYKKVLDFLFYLYFFSIFAQ